MVKAELINNDTLVRHYSDAGVMLLQNETGIMYEEAIDVIPCAYTYTETDQLVDTGDYVEESDHEDDVDVKTENSDTKAKDKI